MDDGAMVEVGMIGKESYRRACAARRPITSPRRRDGNHVADREEKLSWKNSGFHIFQPVMRGPAAMPAWRRT
jgi:hypothetical protein